MDLHEHSLSIEALFHFLRWLRLGLVADYVGTPEHLK